MPETFTFWAEIGLHPLPYKCITFIPEKNSMRRTELKEKRNKQLVKKFHELYNVKRLRMDDVLKELSEKHFFLHEATIYAIIFYDKKYNEYYNKLIENN